MKSSWQISDIIDLEYFISQDESLRSKAGEEPLKERDRKIFLEEIAPGISKSFLNDTRFMLRKWLDARRRGISEADGTDQALPGRIWNELYSIFSWLLFAAGVTSGAGLAFSLLSYSGSRPINVFLYLAVMVFSQTGLLLLALCLYAWRKLAGRHAPFSLSVSLLSRLFSFLSTWLGNHAQNFLDAGQRTGIQAVTGILRTKQQMYHHLFIWPFFIMLQITGMGFNAGAIGATLLKIAGSDLAFGWQSTLDISADTISSFVKVLALPWSWFIPAGIAFPDPAQIQGSRLVLKDGILMLATPDLASWWPFLCLALLFYGMIPRLILLAAGRLRLARALESLDFNRNIFREIVRRMLVPRLTSACDSSHDHTAADSRKKTAGHKQHDAGGTVPSSAADLNTKGPYESALVLIPEELVENVQSRMLSHLLEHSAGLRQQAIIPVDDACDHVHEPCGAKLRGMLSDINTSDINTSDINTIDTLVCIREAWQPPIEETLSFFRNLRMIAGPDCHIMVALVGMPVKDTMFTPVNSEDMHLWQKQLMALGDPDLGIMELVQP